MGTWLAQFPKTSLGWLAFIRIAVGLAMLTNALEKLGVKLEGGPPATNWLTNAAVLKGRLEGSIKSPAVDPLYKGFLEAVALPNVEFFAALVVIGEVLVGLSLILGLLTRLGGVGAVFLCLNYMLYKGLPTNGGWIDRFVIVLGTMLAVTAAGSVLGLDGLLRAWAPGWVRALMSPAPEAEPKPGAVAVPGRQVQPA